MSIMDFSGKKACPAEAICYRYGFGNEKTKENS